MKKKKYIFKINKKGQAASVDALVFLSIVGIVFSLIIGSAMNYGLNIMNSAKKLYNNNFHYAALKTFMNASYGRDAQDLLKTNVSDSIATLIKEDYGANSKNLMDKGLSPGDPNYDNNLLSTETKLAMFGVLDQIFLPLPQRSYFLLITHNVSDSTVQVTKPLILIIKQYQSYFVCYVQDNKLIESYLKLHPLDLEIVEGNFIFYKNILSTSNDDAKKIKKEDGSIYLGSWLSSEENSDVSTLSCEDYTANVKKTIYGIN